MISATARRNIIISFLAFVVVSSNIYYLYPNRYPWDKDQAAKVRIGIATWIGYGAVYIAKERGFFRGIDVDIRRIDDADYNAAMLLGEIDGFCNTLDSFVRAAAGGVPGRIVYLFDESAGASSLIVQPTINSLADLKNRRVAAQTDQWSHFLLLFLMQSAGIGPNDYTHINLDSDAAGAAFMRESGDLAGAVTREPWLTRGQEAGKGKLLEATHEHTGILVDALIIRPELVQRRPKVVRALVAGLIEAADFWKANPSLANEIVARNFSLKAEDVGQMILGVRHLDRSQNQVYLKQQGRALQTIALANRIWRAAGRMTRQLDLSAAVTDEFVK